VVSPTTAELVHSQQFQGSLGLLERRNHVDTGPFLARVCVELARKRQAFLGCARAGVAKPVLHLLGDDDAGYLIVEPDGELVRSHHEDADKDRNRPAADELFEAVEVAEVEEGLGHREPGAGLDLLAEVLFLIVVVALYRLLKDVQEGLSRLMLIFAVISLPIALVAVSFEIAAVSLVALPISPERLTASTWSASMSVASTLRS